MATRISKGRKRPLEGLSRNYALLALFVLFIFLMGGGQRADVQSLTIVRPVAALVCGYGLWALRREDLNRFGPLFWLLGAAALLCVIHLIPLPPALWRALPGREIVVQIDQVAGLGDIWRPLSMVPWMTWNALFSLLVPLATLLLAIRLDRREREWLLPLLIAIGMVSGIVGLLQTLGGVNSPLHFYNTTNRGWATGLFANRNHAAVFLTCLFPMLAAHASRPAPDLSAARIRLWLAVTGGLVLLPMIAASGSRAALILTLPALLSAPLIYRRPVLLDAAADRRRRSIDRRAIYAAAAVVVVALALLAMAITRTDVLDRVRMLTTGEDVRAEVWGGIVADIWRYLPVGSGIGSFAEVFQIHEADAVLRPTYMNHAHNDLLEVAMTAGLPGLALAAVAVLGWTRASYAVWRSQSEGLGAVYGRMASVVLFVMVLASLADYPLRTSSLASFVVIVAVLLLAGGNTRQHASGLDVERPGPRS